MSVLLQRYKRLKILIFYREIFVSLNTIIEYIFEWITLPSQASAKASGSSLSYTQKVMRTYQVALKCSSFDQRKEINQRIRRSEIQQAKLLT